MIEAPLDEGRTAQILSWLETVTDKPVTHVVQSHHHVDHSAGLRSMAGLTGATVVAGAAAVPLYENAFTAESQVVPDGVDGSGIEIVAVGAESVTLDDSTNPVTAYPFGNPHAEDYVLVDAAGALWVVDILSPQTGAPFPQFLADFSHSTHVAMRGQVTPELTRMTCWHASWRASRTNSLPTCMR